MNIQECKQFNAGINRNREAAEGQIQSILGKMSKVADGFQFNEEEYVEGTGGDAIVTLQWREDTKTWARCRKVLRK